MNAYKTTVREWPEMERPREKLERYGPSTLSNAELLAIILRTGTMSENVLALAQRLLVNHGGVAGLADASMAELRDAHGVGLAKAAQLQAALELGKRLMLTPNATPPQVTSPQDAVNLIRDMGLLKQEVVKVILLDTKNHVIASPQVYQGSVNAVNLRYAELFRAAVKHNAVALILVHNHPSGDPTPSPEDIAVTRQTVDAGTVLKIDVLDHIVIARQGFVSLRKEGLGFLST